MKNNKIIIGLLAATLGLTSCGGTKKQDTEKKDSNQQKEVVSKEISMSVEKIDQFRTETEALSIKPIEVLSTNLREKTKQKWSKIHFYVNNDVVVKIKTYPYKEISKRTEEFYANKTGLLLAVIEDNGEGAKGKPKNEIDKLYYFNGDKLIKELTKGGEKEFNVRNSDAEELLVEFKEYMDIYTKTKK